MEAMGQMGNGDEAVVPDDLPFDLYDLEVEEDNNNMAEGGMPQDPRDKVKSGFVTFNGETGFIPNLNTIPENMRDKVQVREA